MTTTSNAPAAIDHLSVAERAARGKAARAEVPRSSHAAWAPPARRPDPVEILELQAPSRVPDLVPIRYGRMLVSPFTFYRGAAAIMASDLSLTPRSGLQAQICGDAHISNFGVFAAPDRKLIFDVNDFDETLPGPWEWDVKRMAASIEIACRQRDLKPGKRRAAVTAAVREYRMAMRRFAGQGNLEVWYARLDEDDLVARFESDIRRQDTEDLRRLARKARNKDSVRALSKLTHEVDGELRFLSAPPLLVPIEELLPADDARDQADIFQSLIRTYRSTLPADRRHLLESYRYVHIARKVVGVGSVGTRAWVILLVGRDGQDPLVLQAKEAQTSVLEPYVGASVHANHGERVVAGQRLMQGASDIFLGWEHVAGMDGVERDFYIRQLWDGKLSADVDNMPYERLVSYVKACGWTLARTHARSGDRVAIASYLGSGDTFDEAIATFSEAYADQNELDHRALLDAVDHGRVAARTGI
ncbi:MAG TPA: DUF2252 domain-containing protein [Solirubrobacteraceae bacterium]